jgi:hypothetical protein
MLTSHATVVALAVTGGVLALAAMVISNRGETGQRAARWLNAASYGFMGASMLIFILAGLLR